MLVSGHLYYVGKSIYMPLYPMQIITQQYVIVFKPEGLSCQ